MDEIRNIKSKCIEELNKYTNESKKFSNLRLIVFLLIVGIALANFKMIFKLKYIVIEIALIIIFIFIVIREVNADKNKCRLENIIKLTEKYEKRENGQWSEFDETGDEFIKEYSYLLDLQILGKNSLYQFLNCATTLGGKKKLAERFNVVMEGEEKSIEEDAKIYQSAIGELAGKKELLLDFQEKISSIDGMEHMDAQNEKDAFEMKRKFSNFDFFISLILSTITICLAVMSKLNVYYLLALVPMIFIQFVSAILYQTIYNKEIVATGKHMKKLKELQKVCHLFENEKFESEKLNQLSNKLIASKEVFNKIKKIDALESFRRNFLMWFIGNVFFSLNRFIVREYGKIEKEDKETVYESLLAIEELEIIISLSTINIVKKRTCRPEFIKDTKIEVKNIKHPMLLEDKCVPNNFYSPRKINIITGSNMSGKTSFMKTIGMNLVLAYSGAYVNCDKMVVPIMKIYTSINVKDDINKGISKFYAELLRIKDAINGAKQGEKLVLFVDEIFSGTNYQDRIYGAKNIIRKFSEGDVIGFITTHDFELCKMNREISDNINDDYIENYHFAEEYIDGKMHFNHKIKSGKCNGTNAIELMDKLGILD